MLVFAVAAAQLTLQTWAQLGVDGTCTDFQAQRAALLSFWQPSGFWDQPWAHAWSPQRQTGTCTIPVPSYNDSRSVTYRVLAPAGAEHCCFYGVTCCADLPSCLVQPGVPEPVPCCHPQR